MTAPRESALGPLLRLAAASMAGRAIKNAAAEATQHVLGTLAAALTGVVGLFCFSTAALILMERHMDPAAAWAAMGCFYGLLGCGVYLLATRRRR